VAAVERINADYLGHCRRAREIARECFDAERILPRMLAEQGV
jgi:hypothetical protein